MDTLHNAVGLRMVIEAYRSSPILSILNFAEIPPLKVRRLQISLKFKLKIVSSSTLLIYKN